MRLYLRRASAQCKDLSVKQTDDIETLNELARRIQEFTDDRTLCKFEAALELGAMR